MITAKQYAKDNGIDISKARARLDRMVKLGTAEWVMGMDRSNGVGMTAAHLRCLAPAVVKLYRLKETK